MVSDWLLLAPPAAFITAALALFVVDAISSDETSGWLLSGVTTAGGLAAAAIAGVLLLSETAAGGVELFGGQLVVDGMSLLFTFIFGSVTALVAVASLDYIRDLPHKAEYYLLISLAATGMSLMASANSLVVVFISLELASLPSYALVAYLKNNRGSVEAGLKYFLIGALSSGIMLYGISLIYATTGSFLLGDIAASVGEAASTHPGVFGVGLLMVIGGFAFKTASVPFHFWAPDAYEGAPAPVAAFLSSASKAAGFVIAFRVLLVGFPIQEVAATVDWVLLFQILAVVTMTVGNFAAATQSNVKRMLAYSSIGHAGYVLIGLAALTNVGGPTAEATVLGASMLHLLVYGFMNTGAFLFVAMVEHWDVGRTFEDYNGLAREAPLACVAMTIFLFSLAGLPVGGGFLSKYYLVVGAVGTGVWWLAVVLAINSALSLYYYSRVVKAMWIESPAESLTIERYPTALYAAVMAAAAVTVLLLPGLFVFDGAAFDAAAALL
ncbi:NADH dehydrogenase-like complex subunit N [Natronomonas pharaonis DSM 2160]|uniref:NADH dehydrogenase-like complex subunit N n=1 Tax=Natronomonas pharaonis (strain ATCC 35678 / DSM 2160 / CIP 103997 / JCM 8858 / NBRC 14720 / NCIMB 2260 / Gabara) TaxID=348780 RepID=A0A1U7EW04_NATPD|nr:NADH-quinone oxidoreductase subunit N [Natronomonas pharaonis]CAI49248.1 NADH dehydrogenase-like complex subunit N [Natronomonas pharaonis DSM 2160]